MNFQQLAGLRPVNKAAALAISRSHQFPSAKKISQVHTDLPLPIRANLPSDVPELIGRKFGRFTVIGAHASSPPLRWIVRCVCGRYETRKTRAVMNPANAQTAARNAVISNLCEKRPAACNATTLSGRQSVKDGPFGLLRVPRPVWLHDHAPHGRAVMSVE